MSAVLQRTREATPARPRRRRRLRENTNPVTVLVFLLPTLMLVLGLRMWPLFESIRLSFTNWDGISAAHFIGFDNYMKLWHDHVFWRALGTNLKLLLAVPIFVLVPLLIAGLLQGRIPGRSVFRSAFFFPTLLSPAVIAITFQLLLKENGPLNGLLRLVGLGSLTRVWLTDPHWALIWLVIIVAWAHLGVGVVIYLAAMGAVDVTLIDAARLEGCNWLQVQRHVVFHQIIPVVELMTVINVIGVLTNFFPIALLMTDGGPDYATTTADLYSYRLAFENFTVGYSSAVVVVIFLITMLLFGLVFVFFRKRRVA